MKNLSNKASHTEKYSHYRHVPLRGCFPTFFKQTSESRERGSASRPITATLCTALRYGMFLRGSCPFRGEGDAAEQSRQRRSLLLSLPRPFSLARPPVRWLKRQNKPNKQTTTLCAQGTSADTDRNQCKQFKKASLSQKKRVGLRHSLISMKSLRT